MFMPKISTYLNIASNENVFKSIQMNALTYENNLPVILIHSPDVH